MAVGNLRVRGRSGIRAVAAVALPVVAALPVGASPAVAAGELNPDFNDHPTCVADILAISCAVRGTGGGGKIVSWEWEYPGAFSSVASGKETVLRFDSTGVFDVTLTVTAQDGRTGSAEPLRATPRTPVSAPDLSGGLDDQLQLRLLLVVGEHVALHSRREPALRGQAQLTE